MRRQNKGWLLLIVFLFVWMIFSWDGLGRWMYPMNYEEPIGRYSAANQVDPYLIAAMIRVESNFDPTKISPKGAVGIMQIMPDTARWIIQKTGPEKEMLDTDLHQIESNIQLGTWYVHYLFDTFEGNEVLMLASYNAGQGTVRKWLDAGQWNGRLDSIDQIPYPETRNYIRKVMFYRTQYIEFYPQQWEGIAHISNGPSQETVHTL